MNEDFSKVIGGINRENMRARILGSPWYAFVSQATYHTRETSKKAVVK
jgi:hypothetical protein